MRDRTSWTKSPVENLSQESTSQLIEEQRLSQRGVGAGEQGCLGCSSWPKTFAFVIGLGLLCAAAVLLPVILTNTLGVVTQTSPTTGKSMNNNFYNYFMTINIIFLICGNDSCQFK